MRSLIRSTRTIVSGAAVAVAVIGCVAESSLPNVDSLADGWNRVFPAGATLCSDSSAYSFFVRPASRDSVMIAFQGGGQCWLGENCSLDHNPTFAPVVNEHDNPSGWLGLWDAEHPENPLANYTQVLVPNCSADLYLGDRTTTYDVAATDSLPAMQVTIHHRGYANAMAVLSWVFRNLEAPRTVFVTGLSSGATMVAFYSAVVQEHYPDTYVVGLGDGSGGSRGLDFRSAWEAWGTMEVLSRHDGYEGISPETLKLPLIYGATAREQPAVRLALINSAGDRSQVRFLRRVGITDTPLLVLLDSNETDIRAVAPTFRSFIYGGTGHIVLRAAGFFFVEADGMRVRDWVAELAAGHDPGDVRCTECDRPTFQFTKTDLSVLMRADELLATASSWRKEDDGQCEDDDTTDRWSLFCALTRGTRDVTGRSVPTAALTEVRRHLRERNPDWYRWPVTSFNNAPETSFSDVKELLRAVIERVDTRLVD